MDTNDTAAASTHRRAWDQIPWVVNGSADAADRELVQAHAADCADCADELARQSQLHTAMTDSVLPAHDPSASLQRLLSRIDRVEGDALGDSPESSASRHRSNSRWTRWLAAAVVVQAVGLAALAGALFERPRTADYSVLTRSAEPVAGASIRLVPAASLQIGQLQAVLAQAGLQIVDSHGDGSILSLAPRQGAAPMAVPDSLAVLRATPGVLLAEPIATDAAVRP